MQLVEPAQGERRFAMLIRHARHPAALTWAMIGLLAVVVGLALPLPLLTTPALLGAVVIGALIALGDAAPVTLEDGGQLTLAPALLVAGLTVCGWPLAMAAALVATMMTAIARRAPAGSTAQLAGARCLMVVLAAPIDTLLRPDGAPPYGSPRAILGLLAIAACIYAVEVALGGAETDEPQPLHWLRRLRALGWYPLALVALGALLGALWWDSPWEFLIGAGVLAVANHLLRSHVALRRASAELEDLAARHADRGERLERLQSLATAMIAAREPRQMLRLLCERLAALLDSPAGWVVVPDEGGAPQLTASHNLGAAGEAAAFDAAAYAALLKRGRVVLITDDAREALLPARSKGQAHGWNGLLVIPLATESAQLGAICLVFEQLRGLDADERRVLSSFAYQAAMTLENARLFDELRHKQAELIQSSKLAAVGTFAAGIAHEFNNLLGGMLGYAQLGRSLEETEEKDRALDVVVQACVRGRSITRGLLTFARRQEPRHELQFVERAIEETLTLVEIDLRKSNVAVVRVIEPTSPTVCDIGQIAQVVLNFITNARDAMQPEGGTLTIGLRERRGVIELRVSDTGHGIPEEIRDRIFEPFVTSKGALGGSQTPGTGLGLSISYGIVKDHGGEIVVESALGCGTTMIVRLPIRNPAG
jgi:signal transduction histidine kinase